MHCHRYCILLLVLGKKHELLPDEFSLELNTLSTCFSFYRCGKCRRFMKYVQAKPARLYCANCDDTYNLPQNGLIKPDQGSQKTCPLDEFELLMWTTGAGGKVRMGTTGAGGMVRMGTTGAGGKVRMGTTGAGEKVRMGTTGAGGKVRMGTTGAGGMV